ncbi:MAG: hypothetical protein GF311_25095 [Candidatus Lokiarchaeota archaeon]|nr:hypothetical protein [Candidatus Lokiarchaeota archaeon]
MQGESLRYKVDLPKTYTTVIDTLLRTRSIALIKHQTQITKNLSENIFIVIRESQFIPLNIIRLNIKKFLSNISYYTRFLREYTIHYEPNLNSAYRTVRVYLHKLHRIAPVFEYSRAKINLKTLQGFCYRKNIWPHLTTQLAMTIALTDKNNTAHTDKLKNINVRLISNCSAYAFYELRKKLLHVGVIRDE